jgi:NADH-quinone oxidoreductase subunit L
MVTAGVYLLARTHALFALVPAFGLVIAVVAAATALLAALAAMVQHDLKRVLAFSTISQLGFMFLAVGAGAPAVALFHVVTHACFKACLFLAAGAVIHALGELGAPPPIDRMLDFRRGFDARNPQDMRNMGGLGKRLPVVRAAYFAACWAIAGLPLGAGFFSKDAILEAIVASPALGQAGPFLALAALVTAGLTAFYMFRSYYLVFAGRPRPRAEVHHLHRPTGAMTAVLIVLGLASLGAGALLGWPEALRLDAHPRPPLLLGWLSHLASAAHGEAVESPAARRLALDLMGLGLISAVGGWYVARMLFKDEHRSRPFRERLANRLDGWHARAFAFFRLDALYDVAVVAPTLAFSRAAARFDAGVVDGLVRVTARAGTLLAEAGAAVDRWIVDGAVNGVAALLSRAGQRLSRVQSGRLGDYLRTTLLGLLLAGLAVAGAFWMTR